MINIRQGLFETNSSSMHSIGIQRNNQFENVPEKLELKPGEFGWQHEVLSDPFEIGSYLYTAILCLSKDKKDLSDWKTYLYDACYRVGCEVSFIEPTKDEYGFENYYIDHCDELIDFLKKLRRNEKRLLRFLFGQHSFIITSNDNDGHEYLEAMEKSLINNYVETYFKGN